MGKSATGEGFAAVTPDDSTNIATKNGLFPRALYFGTGGTCTLVAPDNSTGVFKNIPNGATLDFDVKRVNSTGLTGCADIVAIY